MPERYDIVKMRDMFTESVMGKKIIYRSVVDSTNKLAKILAEQGAMEGTVVLADEQTKGRGRFGRIWHSPNNFGLWFSIVLRPELEPQNLGILSLLPSVAIAQAVKDIYSKEVGLKWPNDVLLNHKKIAGVLSETKCCGEKVNFLILGVGVNLMQNKDDFPQDIRNKATSMFIETGLKPHRIDILASILSNMNELYVGTERGGMPYLIEKWRRYAVGLGEQVIMQKGDDDIVTGKFENISIDGSAIIRLDDGKIQTLFSGECTIIGDKHYASNS